MPQKDLFFSSFLVAVIGAFALFIVWRVRRLVSTRAVGDPKALTDQKAVAAFEEMNRITKQLRDEGRKTPIDPQVAPGERLKRMYPGAKAAGEGTPAK
jgi:hypothetical protein